MKSISQISHLREPADVAFFARKSRPQERIDQLIRHLLANDPGPQGQHVHVVMLDSLVRRLRIMAQACAYPRILFAATEAPTPLPQIRIPSYQFSVFSLRLLRSETDD